LMTEDGDTLLGLYFWLLGEHYSDWPHEALRLRPLGSTDGRNEAA
jgi:hypothetical protein